MSDEMIEKAQKYLTFVYVTLKIGVRDLYVLPIGHINSLLKTAGILMIITGICEFFDLLSFLDFKGVFLAFIILLIIKIVLKLQEKNNF